MRPGSATASGRLKPLTGRQFCHWKLSRDSSRRPAAPLPPVVDELAFAGYLRGKPVRITKALTVDLDVPADADFIIEGWVDNEDLRVEGPFGDHTGVYSAADLYPTLMRALEVDGPALVEVPIDYRENLRLTERLGALSGPS